MLFSVNDESPRRPRWALCLVLVVALSCLAGFADTRQLKITAQSSALVRSLAELFSPSVPASLATCVAECKGSAGSAQAFEEASRPVLAKAISSLKLTAVPCSSTGSLEEHSKISCSRLFVVLPLDASSSQVDATVALTSYVWSKHLDVTPIVLMIVKSSRLTSIQLALVSEIANSGGHVVFLTPRRGDSVLATLRIGRLAAFALPFVREGDVLLTADSDVWPLNPKFWKRKFEDALEGRSKFVVFDGRARLAGDEPSLASTSFLMGSMGQWKKMYEESFGVFTSPVGKLDIHTVIHAMLDRGARLAFEAESWDGPLMSQLMKASHVCPDNCDLSAKLDSLEQRNGAVIFKEPVLGFTSAQLPPSLTKDAFASLRPVWESLFGNSTSADRIQSSFVFPASV